ncbi:transposase of IS200 family [Streptococcus pseudoporcinus]|uniref:Transposase of IS200 family n=1 Tax=Streptococcus pseudoporcinus TaxID=361101 RepID=A0A4U9Y427_9STRE|nr:transposase of IS200 family [Streptococcus pseudoporcinus]VUC69943.1 transposase of IS200 family [Streptococcus pseudoporcinus]VUD00106.1 transposase of IS200 family [Streptococcus pseudoporcinus]VUD00498.1 transposase of IS200 family [Streptococcus pseudoporcinus]
MFDKHANLKYKFGNRYFWAEGYYVSTVGLNEAETTINTSKNKKYDIALDKLSVKELEDSFRDSGK